jgi:hypothetical protein
MIDSLPLLCKYVRDLVFPLTAQEWTMLDKNAARQVTEDCDLDHIKSHDVIDK